MKTESEQIRHRLVAAAVGLYLLPIIGLASMSAIGWKLFSLGLLLAMGGTVWLLTLLLRWEASLDEEVVQGALPRSWTSGPAEPLPIERSLELVKQEHIRELVRYEETRKELEQRLHSLGQELAATQSASLDQLQQRDRSFQDQQRALDEQKVLIELQKQQLADLTSREQDLKYEIKTLLQLTSMDADALDSDEKNTVTALPTTPVKPNESAILPEISVHSSESARQHLRRCLDIAAKITTSSPSLGDLPETRRLFDALSGENACGVLLYSPKESRLLFANGQIKKLLGWVPETFLQQFHKIIEPGSEYWKLALAQLAQQSEAQVTLPCKNNEGSNRQLKCHLATVSSGFFRNHIVAVLY